jgi:hypothetical protein
MVALGFGKFARADRIYALERITGEERGDGRRTRVWIDGVADPLIASRTETTILRDMGQETAIPGPELDEALDLAARLAAAAELVAWTSATSAVGRDAFSPQRLHLNSVRRYSQFAGGMRDVCEHNCLRPAGDRR